MAVFVECGTGVEARKWGVMMVQKCEGASVQSREKVQKRRLKVEEQRKMVIIFLLGH